MHTMCTHIVALISYPGPCTLKIMGWPGYEATMHGRAHNYYNNYCHNMVKIVYHDSCMSAYRLKIIRFGEIIRLYNIVHNIINIKLI